MDIRQYAVRHYKCKAYPHTHTSFGRRVSPSSANDNRAAETTMHHMYRKRNTGLYYENMKQIYRRQIIADRKSLIEDHRQSRRSPTEKKNRLKNRTPYGYPPAVPTRCNPHRTISKSDPYTSCSRYRTCGNSILPRS